MPQLEHHFLEGTGPRCFLPFLAGDEIGFLRDAVRDGFPPSRQEKIERWLAEALGAVDKYYGYDVEQGVKDFACERWGAPQPAMPTRRDWAREDEAVRRKLTFVLRLRTPASTWAAIY